MQREPRRYISELVGAAASELGNAKFMKRRYWERPGLLCGSQISSFGDVVGVAPIPSILLKMLKIMILPPTPPRHQMS